MFPRQSVCQTLKDFPTKWFNWHQKRQRNKINSMKNVSLNQSKITQLKMYRDKVRGRKMTEKT